MIALLGAATAPVAAAHTPADADDTTFVVALDESGDAEATLRLVFDVSTEQDRQAIERLRANRTTVLAEFGDGMQAVAAGAQSETGRPMSVSGPTMSVTTEGEEGVVEISLTWQGLAAVDDDRLRVTAPFGEGFQTPGRFVLRGPDGYEVVSAALPATTQSGAEATWATGTRLDGFEVVFAPAGAAGDAPSLSLPGFGVPAALLALTVVSLLSVFVARRRT